MIDLQICCKGANKGEFISQYLFLFSPSSVDHHCLSKAVAAILSILRFLLFQVDSGLPAFQGWDSKGQLIALSIVDGDGHRGAAGHLLVVRHVLVLRVRPKLPVLVASVAAISFLLPIDIVGHHAGSGELGRSHGGSCSRGVLETEGSSCCGKVSPLGSGNHGKVGVHDAASKYSGRLHPSVGQRVDSVRAGRGEVLWGGERGGDWNAQVLRVRAAVHLPVLLPAEAEVVRWEAGRERELVVRVDAQVVVQLGQVASPRGRWWGASSKFTGAHLSIKMSDSWQGCESKGVECGRWTTMQSYGMVDFSGKWGLFKLTLCSSIDLQKGFSNTVH